MCPARVWPSLWPTGYLWGWSRPESELAAAHRGPHFRPISAPSSSLATLQVVYLGPGDSCCFQLASDWAKVTQWVTRAHVHVRAHTHTHKHGCRDSRSFPGLAVPRCPGATAHLCRLLPTWEQRQMAGGRRLSWLGEQHTAFWLTDLQGLGSTLRETGVLDSVAHLPPIPSSTKDLWGTRHVISEAQMAVWLTLFPRAHSVN